MKRERDQHKTGAPEQSFDDFEEFEQSDALDIPGFDEEALPSADESSAEDEQTHVGPITAHGHDAEPEDLTPSEPESPTSQHLIDALELSSDVPVQLVAVLAKKNISMRELLQLRPGAVVDLQRPPSETVDIVAGGKLVARGELVEIDGRLGVRILQLVRTRG